MATTDERIKPAHPLPALRPTTVDRYKEVQLERSHDGRVATIEWDPPKPMNPLSVTLTDELVAAVEEVSADEQLHVVVFRGAGGYFSGGGDLIEVHGGGWGGPHPVVRRLPVFPRVAKT